jgi:hypothetical protein
MPYEPGGADYQNRNDARDRARLARQLVQDRAQEICEMVAEDWEVGIAIHPFVMAPEGHPLRESAHLIAYMVNVSPDGSRLHLMRVIPEITPEMLSAGWRGEEMDPAPALGKERILMDLDEDADFELKRPGLYGLPDNCSAMPYEVSGRLDIEKINEFLAHLSLGLLTYMEQSLGRIAASRVKTINASAQAAFEELKVWDAVHRADQQRRAEVERRRQQNLADQVADSRRYNTRPVMDGSPQQPQRS